MPDIGPDTEVQYVKGVGPLRAKALQEVGIHRAADLLLRLPFRYEDRSVGRKTMALADGESASVEVVVDSVRVRPTRRRGLKIVELRGRDETGEIRATWFNQVYLKQVLQPGQRVLLYGKVKRPFARAIPELSNPRHELVDGAAEAPGRLAMGSTPTHTASTLPPEDGAAGVHVGRVVPIYERVGPVTPRLLRSILHRLVEAGDTVSPSYLPVEIEQRLGLVSRQDALQEVHFPSDDASLDTLGNRRSPGHERLILEEFFLFALGLLLRRRQDRTGRTGAQTYEVDDELRDRVRQVLPFTLTGSQFETLATVADEFKSPLMMRRLLQGDVGSGKTIVAVIAALIVLHNGAQVALMAPTEVLAEQHFATIRRLLEPHGIRVALLTAKLGAADQRDTLKSIATGWTQFVIGTHSLIQEGAEFQNLGFAVVDEQHRFGVAQRQTLVERGGGCDLLVMTATPIPRTLTMALHGDLDLSELRELPPGRQPIRTRLRSRAQMPEVYKLVRDEVKKGGQTFWVCPTIEESEQFDSAGVEARFEELARGPLRGLRIDFVHGKVPAKQRERTMNAFVNGELDVLVATTVIEVGVDVPRATVMVVEHAERFGLATLHQLRGRVGRGTEPSTAVLVVGDSPTELALRRLRVLEESTDGFRIAEEDLAIRGPGDFLGTRQSGIPPFRVADIVRDADFLRRARKEAEDFLASPAADTAEGERILEHVRATWGERFGLTAGG